MASIAAAIVAVSPLGVIAVLTVTSHPQQQCVNGVTVRREHGRQIVTWRWVRCPLREDR